MEYDPYQIFEGNEREYGEWMSGDEAYCIQVSPFHLLLGQSYTHTGSIERWWSAQGLACRKEGIGYL